LRFFEEAPIGIAIEASIAVLNGSPARGSLIRSASLSHTLI
jgi:hypothetical protein